MWECSEWGFLAVDPVEELGNWRRLDCSIVFFVSHESCLIKNNKIYCILLGRSALILGIRVSF